MPSTLDVYETRRANLTKLLQEPGSKTQLAARLGASQSHITHLLKPPSAASARAIREETARQIEEIMGLAMGQLDKPAFQSDMIHTDAQGRHTEVQLKPYGVDARRRLRGQSDTPTYLPVQVHEIDRVIPADPEILEEAFRQVLEGRREARRTHPAREGGQDGPHRL